MFIGNANRARAVFMFLKAVNTKQERFEHFCECLVQHWLQKVHFSNILKFLPFRNVHVHAHLGGSGTRLRMHLVVTIPDPSGCTRKGLGNNLARKCLAEMPRFKSCKLRSQIFNAICQVLLHFYVLLYIHFLPLVELEH